MELSPALGLPVSARPTVAWPDEPLGASALVAQLGGEVARALSSALERVSSLAATGQIDRDNLRALREEIDLARRSGINGQQLIRLAAGEVRLAHERVALAALLREAVNLRQRESRSRDIQIKQTYAELTLVSDAALMFSLVETTLDWAFEHARSRLVLRLDAKTAPARGRLTCAFLRRQPDGGLPGEMLDGQDTALSTFSWRLLQQTAAVLGLTLTRHDTADRSEMRLTLPGAEPAPTPTVPGLETDEVSSQFWHEQPLAGRHVVVLAAQREVRNIVRDLLRPMGPMIDFVATLDEARQLFEDALPHAILHEAAFGGERFDRLRRSLLQEAPALAFIQIANGSEPFEMLQADGHRYASMGVDALHDSLPAALLFELSRGG